MKSGNPSEFGSSDSSVGGAAHGGKRGKRSSRATLVVLLLCVSVFSFSCRRPAAPPPPPPPEASAPPPPAPAPAITLTAAPASIDQGGSTTLEWTARNANAVRIEPGVGAVATQGTRSVSPTASVTYTATASGPGGTSTDTVRVTVNTPAPPPAAPARPDQPAPTIAELFARTVLPIYFDYDQAEIRPDQVGQLQNNMRFLMQNQGVQFTVSGHADERGSQEYNIGLGDRRANAVRQYLIDNGIGAGRINTVSFGEDRPVCSETTEACYQRNRRAEFVLR